MDYVDHSFVDETVHLDNNTFTRCTFERCVLHYAGGNTSLLETTNFRVTNRIEFGPGVDPHANPISQFLITAMLKSGGTVTGDPDGAQYEGVAPQN